MIKISPHQPCMSQPFLQLSPAHQHPLWHMLSHFLQIHIDRKSTRLNSSHLVISYAVFCLKNKDEPVVAPQHQGRRGRFNVAGTERLPERGLPPARGPPARTPPPGLPAANAITPRRQVAPT